MRSLGQGLGVVGLVARADGLVRGLAIWRRIARLKGSASTHIGFEAGVIAAYQASHR
jgi:hypothetical protein